MPRTLFAHERQHSACDVHRSEDVRLELLTDLLVRRVLKPTKLTVASIVYEHVNSPKTLLGSGHSRRNLVDGGHVKFDRKEMIRRTESCCDGFVIATGCHDLVACVERCPSNFRPQPPRSPCNKPNL